MDTQSYLEGTVYRQQHNSNNNNNNNNNSITGAEATGILPHWVRTLKCLFKGLRVEVNPDQTYAFSRSLSFKEAMIQKCKVGEP